MQRRVFRPTGWKVWVLVFAAFAMFFLSAVFWLPGNNWLAAVLAVVFFANACDTWRRGLFVEDAGIRIVRPWRPRAVVVGWQDIDRFELSSGAGETPVNLIRASDHQRIAIPTFARPRKSIDPSINPRAAGFYAKVQAQVDELNLLQKQHTGATS